jgi:hypothetical protein
VDVVEFTGVAKFTDLVLVEVMEAFPVKKYVW